jgi:hypothetical protein
MRLYCSIFLSSIILAACSQKKATEVSASPVDSTVVQSAPAQITHVSVDSSVYIGSIMSFPETAEYYTPIYYMADQNPYEYLEQQLDSVVYDKEEIKRSRLPLSIAQQYFNLTGLGRISVYNQAGNIITDATLQRIELLEGVLESEFVAVFKPMIPSWFTTDASYCVSSTLLPDFPARFCSFQELTDERLTSQLLKQFEIDSADVWTFNHQVLQPHNTIFSIIATDAKSLLIETSNNVSHIIFETNADYSIMEVSPIHLEANGKPILLALMGVNETDMIWTSLLVYNSIEYEVMDRGRIGKE